jgi:aminoglycoside 6-adenylyltransferase
MSERRRRRPLVVFAPVSKQSANESGLARVDELLDRVCAWGRAREDVRGIILFGSQARTSRPADRWSDVDLLISCHNPRGLLESRDWLEALGEARVTFLETNPVDGEKERRVLFADGLDVDFNMVSSRRLRLLNFALGRWGFLVPASSRRQALDGVLALTTIMCAGFRILLDKDGVLARVAGLVSGMTPPLPSERPLDEIASDFWYHAVWTAKKLRRGELWMAKRCCDSYLKDRFLEVYSLARSRSEGLATVRFIDEALDTETAKQLRESYSAYDRAGVARALTATLDLFAHAARQASERLGVSLDADEERFARTEVARVLSEATDSPESPS